MMTRIFGFGRRPKYIKQIKPANLRHHDITDDELGALFDRHGERFFTVAGRNNIVTLGE